MTTTHFDAIIGGNSKQHVFSGINNVERTKSVVFAIGNGLMVAIIAGLILISFLDFGASPVHLRGTSPESDATVSMPRDWRHQSGLAWEALL